MLVLPTNVVAQSRSPCCSVNVLQALCGLVAHTTSLCRLIRRHANITRSGATAFIIVTKEVDCGEKASPFRACCPSSTTCPVQYNTACCPANTNCTAALVEIPICANSSWVMFDNGGYFCCERGQVGYNIYDTDGCSLSGRALPQDAVPLAVVDQTSFSAPKSTSMRPTTSPSGSPPPPPNTNNTVSGGTIAGAVVGGIAGVATIAGLLWWSFMRGKTSSSVATNQVSQPPQGSNGGGNQNSGYSTAP